MINVNIAEILLPISENHRCGDNLKYDYIYDQIKELRREDDPELSQGIWQMDLKKANWQEVNLICFNLLKTRTKDLQIAMWLLESLIALEGFVGFNQGISVLLALCENFWSDIYPLIGLKSNNFTSRLAPFYFFSEKIPERLVLIPLVSSADGVSENYNLSDWLMARHNLQTKNSNGISLRQLSKSVVSTQIEFFHALENEVNLSIENLKKLDAFITGKCGEEAPSFRGILDYLYDVQRITSKNFADKRSQLAQSSCKQQIKQEYAAETAEASKPERQENSVSVEQAYEALEEIAVFLEQKQPQSPASILIKMAVVIGKKNFQELLKINIKSGTSVINTISELYQVLVAQ